MLSGFLQADPAAIAAYRSRIAARAAGRPCIGLSWRSGNRQYGTLKSLTLHDLAPLLRRQDLCWVDLQYGDTADERAGLEAQGLSLWRDPAVDPLGDLDAAAAQYAALDLVITISNTAAHLAGSLGCATWLLLPAPGHGLLWYWGLERSDSPVYPGLRCFRQPGGAAGWAPVVGAVESALAARYPLNP